MGRLHETVTAVSETDVAAFQRRVDTEVDRLQAELEIGTFDNTQALVGLEYEFYGADGDSGALRRTPQSLLDLIRFENELGVHNAEFTASPQPFGPHGLAAVTNETKAALRAAGSAAAEMAGIELISDGLWTIPPIGETTTEYFEATTHPQEPILAANISDAPRYHAMSNSPGYQPDCRIDTPNATAQFNTVLPAALTASIQPHYQVPIAGDLPTYLRYAIRIAGPVLALAVNSPLLPPGLYDDEATVASVLDTGHLETRVSIFETVMNDTTRQSKVRLPRDIDTTDEAVERLAGDPPITPVCKDADNRFDDQFCHLRHKHSSYWRWVRPVFEGATRADANARVEFRPLPAQPTLPDSVSLLAVVGGLLSGLVEAEHPVAKLPWEQAKANFYAAARNGLAAELQWITADGTETTDTDVLYTDLFEYAQRGLKTHRIDGATVASYLHPLRARVDRRMTPARWKHDRLRQHSARGLSLDEAVIAAKREYLQEHRRTRIDGSFVDWTGV